MQRAILISGVTGFLGSAQGNIVLKGRKKEILVTSYGKNISPQKIEGALKGIEGVSEAMVVADVLHRGATR